MWHRSVEPVKLVSIKYVVAHLYKFHLNFCFLIAKLKAGWGRTTQGGSISPILLSVALDIVPIDICNRTYKGKIQPTMVCAQAADSGQDTCQVNYKLI